MSYVPSTWLPEASEFPLQALITINGKLPNWLLRVGKFGIHKYLHPYICRDMLCLHSTQDFGALPTLPLAPPLNSQPTCRAKPSSLPPALLLSGCYPFSTKYLPDHLKGIYTSPFASSISSPLSPFPDLALLSLTGPPTAHTSLLPFS